MNLLKGNSLVLILLVICISSITKLGGAYITGEDPLSSELINQQSSIGDYYARFNDLPDSLLLENVEFDVSTSGSYFVPGQEASLMSDSPSLRYMVQDQPSSLESIDSSRLIEFLRQLKQGDEKSQLSDLEQANDININLSPDIDLLNETISGPVNDPQDFKTVLNYLNLEKSNSSKQSASLNSLIPLYLDAILKERNKSEKAIDTDEYGEGIKKENPTNSADSVKVTISPSRFGGGEYIDHPLALIGHQYMQGGAGEGHQLLGPDGTVENVQVVKSDHAVPSYCNPPNPCPIGFSAKDGCLEQFINSASFSREYQAKQQCSCDNEHSLFNCASPVTTVKNNIYSLSPSHMNEENDDGSNELDGPSIKGGEGHEAALVSSFDIMLSEARDMNQDSALNGKLETLSRTIQNRFGDLDSVRNLIMKHEKDLAKQHQGGESNGDTKVPISRIVKKSGFIY